MRVDADKFAAVFFVGDHVVNGDFGGGPGGGWDSENRHAGIAGRGDAFEAAHILIFRVGDNNADGFAGILRGAAAQCDKVIRTALAERCQTLLHYLNGGVRHHIGKNLVFKTCAVELVGEFRRQAAGNQGFVGDD